MERKEWHNDTIEQMQSQFLVYKYESLDGTSALLYCVVCTRLLDHNFFHLPLLVFEPVLQELEERPLSFFTSSLIPPQSSSISLLLTARQCNGVAKCA